MERRRQEPGRGAGGPPVVSANKPERAIAAERGGEACLPAEVQEVGAAAHRHMLAGVDEPASDRILKRRRPATGSPAGLENRDLSARAGERRGGS